MGLLERFRRKTPEMTIQTPPGGTRRYFANLLDKLGWERTKYDPKNNYYDFKSPITGHHITIVGPLDEQLSEAGFEYLWNRIREDRDTRQDR